MDRSRLLLLVLLFGLGQSAGRCTAMEYRDEHGLVIVLPSPPAFTSPVAPGEVVVAFTNDVLRLPPGLSESSLDACVIDPPIRAVLQQLRVRAVRRLGDGETFLLIQDGAGREGACADRMAELPSVEFAEPNLVLSPLGLADTRTCTNDAGNPDQWNLHSVVGVGCPSQWQDLNGSDIVIGFLDDGVYFTHPDLYPKYAGGWNWDTGLPNPDPGARDHGTNCASVAMAIANNVTGIAGVAGGWNASPLGARFYAARVHHTNSAITAADLANALDGANNALSPAYCSGCRVYSISLGFHPSAVASELLRRAVLRAYLRGCNVVAGKGHDTACTTVYPGDYERVTTVGAFGRVVSRVLLKSPMAHSGRRELYLREWWV